MKGSPPPPGYAPAVPSFGLPISNVRGGEKDSYALPDSSNISTPVRSYSQTDNSNTQEGTQYGEPLVNPMPRPSTTTTRQSQRRLLGRNQAIPSAPTATISTMGAFTQPRFQQATTAGPKVVSDKKRKKDAEDEDARDKEIISRGFGYEQELPEGAHVEATSRPKRARQDRRDTTMPLLTALPRGSLDYGATTEYQTMTLPPHRYGYDTPVPSHVPASVASSQAYYQQPSQPFSSAASTQSHYPQPSQASQPLASVASAQASSTHRQARYHKIPFPAPVWGARSPVFVLVSPRLRGTQYETDMIEGFRQMQAEEAQQEAEKQLTKEQRRALQTARDAQQLRLAQEAQYHNRRAASANEGFIAVSAPLCQALADIGEQRPAKPIRLLAQLLMLESRAIEGEEEDNADFEAYQQARNWGV
jgi:hypothetical protein